MCYITIPQNRQPKKMKEMCHGKTYHICARQHNNHKWIIYHSTKHDQTTNNLTESMHRNDNSIVASLKRRLRGHITLAEKPYHLLYPFHKSNWYYSKISITRSPWLDRNCRLMFWELCNVQFMGQTRRAVAWLEGQRKTSLILRQKGIVGANPLSSRTRQ